MQFNLNIGAESLDTVSQDQVEKVVKAIFRKESQLLGNLSLAQRYKTEDPEEQKEVAELIAMLTQDLEDVQPYLKWASQHIKKNSRKASPAQLLCMIKAKAKAKAK